ncbi:MAG: protein-export chaperone SecB [Treponema sp.]|jgi:preprotein translocase subunit SecB|nr:protein-export chaperone SecB [Treponema sp.]
MLLTRLLFQGCLQHETYYLEPYPYQLIKERNHDRFFSIIKGKENMGLKEYSNLNAPAAIFPYIRETIASTTTMAGIPPVLIPPINLAAIKGKTYNEQNLDIEAEEE